MFLAFKILNDKSMGKYCEFDIVANYIFARLIFLNNIVFFNNFLSDKCCALKNA